MDKKQLRKEMLAVRAALSLVKRQVQGKEIRTLLLNSEWYKNCERLLTYVSFGEEADTRILLKQALEEGKEVYCPKVFSGNHRMQFYRIYGTEDLKPGCMGILEPDPSDERMFYPTAGCGSLAIIPGLVFDSSRCRIGYGGGYYDRFLGEMKLLKTGLVSAAVCFREQLIPEGLIPEEETDIRPDLLITPDEIRA